MKERIGYQVVGDKDKSTFTNDQLEIYRTKQSAERVRNYWAMNHPTFTFTVVKVKISKCP